MMVRAPPAIADSGPVRVGGPNPSGPPLPATLPPLKYRAAPKPERSRRLDMEDAGKGTVMARSRGSPPASSRFPASLPSAKATESTRSPDRVPRAATVSPARAAWTTGDEVSGLFRSSA